MKKQEGREVVKLENTEETFKVGDVVFLKSGSCPMTISDICTCDNVYVAWQSEDTKLNFMRDCFDVNMLTSESIYG